MALGYGRTGTNNFACSKFIVDINGIQNGATHSTITAALSDASSGDTIFVKPGDYNEDITLVSGVNIMGFNSEGFSSVQAKITGKITLGTASDCSVSDLQIETDADYCIEDAGSTTGSIRFVNCQIVTSSTGGTNLNNANRTLTFSECRFNRTTNSLKDFNVTTCNSLTFEYCVFSGATTIGVASTIAAGELGMRYCVMNRHAVSLSSTATLNLMDTSIDSSDDNLVSVNCDSTGTHYISGLNASSGTAAGINIGANSVVVSNDIRIFSSNATTISGDAGGEIQTASVEFGSTGIVIDSDLTWTVGTQNARSLVLRSATAYAVLCGGTSTAAPLQSIASVGTSGQVLTSNGASSLPTFQDASGGGVVLQQVRSKTSALFDLSSSTIPFDDSIPQNTEGDEIITLAITPTEATSVLVIEATVVGTVDDNSSELTAALFKDSVADAKAAVLVFQTGNENTQGGGTGTLKFWETSGSTSSTTYKIRCGTSTSADGSVNGEDTSRVYGGVSATTITITEYSS
jgi:hypothetical protein